MATGFSSDRRFNISFEFFFPSFSLGLLTRRKWSAGLHPTFWHMEVEEREFITIVYASSSRCAKWAPVRFLSPLSHAHQRRTLLLLLGRRSKSRPRSIVSFFVLFQLPHDRTGRHHLFFPIVFSWKCKYLGSIFNTQKNVSDARFLDAFPN